MFLLDPTDQAAILRHVPATSETRDDLWVLPPGEREVRRERGREDVKWWLQTYLPHYFRSPFSAVHDRVIDLFHIKGQLVVIVLPRDAGKGTLLFGLTLHGITYDLFPFPTRVEYNFDIASQEMHKVVDALLNNPRYLADFDVRPGSPWTPSKGLLTLNTGKQLRYIGMDQVARGTVSLNFRIDPLVANDLESLTSVRSPTQTQKLYDFMTKDIAHAGQALSEGGHTYLYIGTKLSQNCATQRMIDSPLAESYEFPAMIGKSETITALLSLISDQAGDIRDFLRSVRESRAHLPYDQQNPTSEDRRAYIEAHPEFAPFLQKISSYWPERFPMWDLIFEAAKGTDAFMQEMQHFPGDETFQRFLESWFVPYTDLSYEYLFSGDLKAGMSIDPSATREDGKETTDPQAIVVSIFDPSTHDMYWLYASIEWHTPIQFAYEVIRVCNESIPLPSCGHYALKHLPGFTILLESNQAQYFGKALINMVCAYERALGTAATYPENAPELGHEAGEERPEAFRFVHYWAIPTIRARDTMTNKMERIGNPTRRGYFEQRHVHYLPGHSDQDLLKTQHLRFRGKDTHGPVPKEDKCDGPDACSLLEVFWHVYQETSERTAPVQSQQPRRYQPPPRRRAAVQRR